MVPDPGAQARTGAIRLLNQPEAVEVVTGSSGHPISVGAHIVLPARTAFAAGEQPQHARRGSGRRRGANSRVSQMQAVRSVDDVWKVDDEWWRGEDQEIERLYFSLLLESGHRITVYRDMKRGGWYRQASR
jgi:hypothetical protein